ncbi:unnamed protein product [Meloidogyne enterolobii]|uniref:Uncharacterized protein n=1 Tax=Meloidogyne enterolobii TaxID=390850 RepID=A0ACB1ABN7_MELEN
MNALKLPFPFSPSSLPILSNFPPDFFFRHMILAFIWQSKRACLFNFYRSQIQ